MKILAIGDIHGRNDWENFGDISRLLSGDSKSPEFDKYIFVGDYTDSFYIKPIDIANNLERIILLKTKFPDHVVLLLGNHDLMYYLPFLDNTKRLNFLNCSGFNAGSFYRLHDIFDSNKDLFDAAYQYKNYVFTHAGIHIGWYEMNFKREDSTLDNIAEQINIDFHKREYLNGKRHPIFDCGMIRGGCQNVGGIFWADKIETWTKPLRDIHQIVGHTAVDEIKKNILKNNNTSVTYIDVLGSNKKDIKKYLTLEIE